MQGQGSCGSQDREGTDIRHDEKQDTDPINFHNTNLIRDQSILCFQPSYNCTQKAEQRCFKAILKMSKLNIGIFNFVNVSNAMFHRRLHLNMDRCY